MSGACKLKQAGTHGLLKLCEVLSTQRREEACLSCRVKARKRLSVSCQEDSCQVISCVSRKSARPSEGCPLLNLIMWLRAHARSVSTQCWRCFCSAATAATEHASVQTVHALHSFRLPWCVASTAAECTSSAYCRNQWPVQCPHVSLAAGAAQRQLQPSCKAFSSCWMEGSTCRSGRSRLAAAPGRPSRSASSSCRARSSYCCPLCSARTHPLDQANISELLESAFQCRVGSSDTRAREPGADKAGLLCTKTLTCVFCLSSRLHTLLSSPPDMQPTQQQHRRALRHKQGDNQAGPLPLDEPQTLAIMRAPSASRALQFEESLWQTRQHT